MTRAEFISEFAGIVNVVPEELNPETPMESLESWDSVAYLSAMVLIDDKLGLAVRPEVLSGAKKFGDVLAALDSALKD